MALTVLFLAVGCADGSFPERTSPTIAFLFDGTPPDAGLVTEPALAGLELAAREAGDVEVEPLNVGGEREHVLRQLRAMGEDSRVVAAVVAPWTAPPPGAVELLAADGLPIVSLSWAWGPPGDERAPWRSFTAARAPEAVALLSEATEALPEGSSLCLAGDDHETSRALLVTAEQLGVAAGEPEMVLAGVASEGGAAAVAGRIRSAGCPVLAWVGGTTVASEVLASLPQTPATVGTSRIKTDGGLALATTRREVFAVCVCPDVSLTLDDRSQRFVHDLQAESGAAPGPFAVEAYDAGRLLVDLLATDPTRRSVADRLSRVTTAPGLVSPYAFEADGSRSPVGSSAVRRWRAFGSRWLPA